MALDATQRRVVSSLFEKPQTIRQLTVSTGLSDSTVRQTLKLLSQLHEVSMEKDRQPYLYSVSENSSEYKQRAAIDKAKDILLGKVEGSNPITKFLAKVPKEQLSEWPPVLLSISEAIEELESDGLLIDTL